MARVSEIVKGSSRNKLPFASSGKIQRHACQAAFLASSLEMVGGSVLDDVTPLDGGERVTREALLAAEPAARRALLETYLQQQVARMLNTAPPGWTRGGP